MAMDLEPEVMGRLLDVVEELASVSGTDKNLPGGKCNPQQRRFAVAFVLNGGNATDAARVAGWAHPEIAGCRARLHHATSDLIRFLCQLNAGSMLPVAMATLMDIAQDKSAKPETRRNAALDLARLAGGMPERPEKSTVAVQVNTGGNGGAPGAAPSVVIQNVWASQAARLSGIGGTMLDTQPALIEHDDSPPLEG